MPREHASIKMTPEELRAFLGGFECLVLATVDRDGDPWADAVAYRLVDDRLYFRVPADSISYANIQNDPRVCCVVEHRPAGSYYDIKGALLHGHATALVPGTAADQLVAAFEALPDPVEPSRRDGVILSIDLEDSTSFAFEKIQYRYQDKKVSDLTRST